MNRYIPWNIVNLLKVCVESAGEKHVLVVIFVL